MVGLWLCGCAGFLYLLIWHAKGAGACHQVHDDCPAGYHGDSGDQQLYHGRAKEGLSFYLKPDFQKMQEIGVGNVVVAAMTQAFFTLSLGIGAMAIFGSYIGKERSLMGESINVAILDTFVALVSGLIIFPACFTYQVEVGIRAEPDLCYAAQRVQ